MQDQGYRDRILPMSDWMDSTVICDMSRSSMYDWISSAMAKEYAMASDFDNQWRTGGRLDEITEESHLSTTWLLEGIERFVNDRDERRRQLSVK